LSRAEADYPLALPAAESIGLPLGNDRFLADRTPDRAAPSTRQARAEARFEPESRLASSPPIKMQLSPVSGKKICAGATHAESRVLASFAYFKITHFQRKCYP